MKAAIYNPYWDTLGGGERYTASLVAFLLKKGYRTDIEWSDKKILSDIKKRFDLDIGKAKVVDSVNRGDGYDLLFWVSDGSIPTLKSRNNILHFQFPFLNVGGKTLINRMKLFRVKHVVVNSEFTKSFIDPEYGVASEVVYPPVDVEKIKPKRKENIILYVGRFSQLTQAKNQDVLIEVFKDLYDGGEKKWRLVLAGGAEVGAKKSYLDKLKKQSSGYPVSFHLSPSDKKLKELYGKAKIFWSASGFGVEELKNPLKVEHFGMTVVEAMAAKAVPVITKQGGHKEIVSDSEDGLLWETKQELLRKTKKLISDKGMLKEMSVKAHKQSVSFSRQKFEKKFEQLI